MPSSDKTQYQKDAVLNGIIGATHYVGLLTTNPSDDAMTGVVESSLARQSIAATSGWGAISGSGVGPRSASNAAALTWPQPASLVVSTGLQIADAASAGNTKYWRSWGTTTLSAAISTTSATSISVTDGTQLPGSGTYRIRIDTEYMDVTAGQGTNTLTVTRGVAGSTAATHSSGATVQVVKYIDTTTQFQIAAGSLTLSEE